MKDKERQLLRDWLKQVTTAYHNADIVLQQVYDAVSAGQYQTKTDYYTNQLLVSVFGDMRLSDGARIRVIAWLPLTFPVHPPIITVSPPRPGLTDSTGKLGRQLPAESLHCMLSRLLLSLQSEPISIRMSPTLPGQHYPASDGAISGLRMRIRDRLIQLKHEAEATVRGDHERLLGQMARLTENEELLASEYLRLMDLHDCYHKSAAAFLSATEECRQHVAKECQAPSSLFVPMFDKAVYTAFLQDLSLCDALYEAGKLFSERRRAGRDDPLQAFLQAYRDHCRQLYYARIAHMLLE